MNKKLSRGFLWAGLISLLGLFTIAPTCEQDCIMGDDEDVNTLLYDYPYIPTNACIEKGFSFDPSVSEVTLKKRLQIGVYTEDAIGHLKINVGGGTILVKPDVGATFQDNCVIAIMRKDVTLANFKFEGFPNNLALICVAKDRNNIVLNNMDFSSHGGYAVWVNPGSSTVVQNSKFNSDALEKAVGFLETGKGLVLLNNNDPVGLCSALEGLGFYGKDPACAANFDPSFLASLPAATLSPPLCGNNASFEDVGGGKYGCICNQGYMDDTTTANIVDCVQCPGSNKVVENGQCLCAAGYEECPAGSSNCIAKCEGGNICGSTGECVSECSDTEVKTEAGCVCNEQNNYAKYKNLPNAHCVSCGSYGHVTAGECVCNSGFHVSLKGDCVPDNEACEKTDPNAILTAGRCECKDCYVWDVGDVAEGATYDPRCVAIPDCVPPLSCNVGFEPNAEGTECVPSAQAAAGDCGCNFGGEPTGRLQIILPYLLLAGGGLGLRILRRRF